MTTPPLPNKKYDIIYADPPWDCNARENRKKKVLTEWYSVMDFQNIQSMPVYEISKPDAYLYLWIVDSMIPEGLTVMDKWGFTYKRSFIWNKINPSIGYYNRGQHEQLLIGKSGSPKMPDFVDLDVSVISVKRGTHSVKPLEFKAIIERAHPNTDKIELFARPNWTDYDRGWDFWGNEV